MFALTWWAAGHSLPAHAQQSAPAAQTSAAKSAKADRERLTFDLGNFELREVQPTRNETTDVNFQAYLAMASEVTDQDFRKLGKWKHRLRDQVIIAVRTAEDADFQEPNLERLRRIILFRVRRLLKQDAVQDILLSEFTYKTQ
jgi:hypothetical protein